MKGKTKTALAFLLVFLCLGGRGLSAMDWPVEEAMLYRNFGWNDGGQPVLGMVFEGEGKVLCAEAGELLYLRRDGDAAGRLPSPLGSWAAVDHLDGIISIYSHLEDRPTEFPPDDIRPDDIRPDDIRPDIIRPDPGEIPRVMGKSYPLASMGQTGWAERRGVYFSLFDRKERRWVNPSMIISPFPDTAPPPHQDGTAPRRRGASHRSGRDKDHRPEPVHDLRGGRGHPVRRR